MYQFEVHIFLFILFYFIVYSIASKQPVAKTQTMYYNKNDVLPVLTECSVALI